jgi:halocyanin-like protein
MRLAGAGVTVAGLSSAAAGTARAQENGDFDGWLSAVSNYDGTVVDATGTDRITITVGAAGNDGNLAYGPPAVRVDPGTTVVWEWNGKGGTHNVVGENRDFRSGDAVAEAGTTYQRTFESEGTVKYFCTPHRDLGMRGVVVVGGSGGAEPIPADYGGWMDDANNFGGETADLRGQDEVVIDVGAGSGGLAFGPAAARISPGTTVVWEWTGDGGGHNVVGENRDFTSGDTVSEAGTTYQRTFEATGIATYYCNPHRAAGMKGALIVDPAPPAGGAGEEGGSLVFTPELQALGGALLVGVLSPIVFTLVMAYRRDSLGRPTAGGPAERLRRVEPEPETYTAQAAATEPATEIGHDEFDPTGTAGLIVLYFLIIVAMWLFMYFVEFLGNGPTVIG